MACSESEADINLKIDQARLIEENLPERFKAVTDGVHRTNILLNNISMIMSQGCAAELTSQNATSTEGIAATMVFSVENEPYRACSVALVKDIGNFLTVNDLSCYIDAVKDKKALKVSFLCDSLEESALVNK